MNNLQTIRKLLLMMSIFLSLYVILALFSPIDVYSSSETVTIAPGASIPSNTKFYVPDSLSISIGTTVIWTNEDSTLHTVTSGSPTGGNSGVEFDSSYLASGKTFQHTFISPGTFDYYCMFLPFYLSIPFIVAFWIWQIYDAYKLHNKFFLH
jgi:plastocyanin